MMHTTDLFLRLTFFYIGISTINKMVCIDSSDGWILFQRVVFVSMQLIPMFGYQGYHRMLMFKLTLFCDIGLNGLFVVVDAVAVDEHNGFIYWSTGQDIKQSTLNGADIKHVFRAGKLNMKGQSGETNKTLFFLR